MYAIIAPRQFRRQARKFFKQHPELKKRFGEVVTVLQHDPSQPQLRTHPLKGPLEGCPKVRLTTGYRIILMILISDTGPPSSTLVRMTMFIEG